MLGRAATAALRFPRTACGRSAHAHALHALAAAAGSRAVELGPRAVGVAAVVARWPAARWATTEARSPAKGDDAAADNQERQQPVVLRARGPSSGNQRDTIVIGHKSLDLLMQHIAKGRARQAIGLFNQILADAKELLGQLPPNDYVNLMSLAAFNAHLPELYTPHARLQAVKRIMTTAEEFSVRLNPDALRILAEAHANNGDFAGFEAVLDMIRQRGGNGKLPSLLAAHSRAYLIAGQEDKGMQIWDELAVGNNLAPALEHLFETHAMRGDTDGAVRTLERLVAQFPKKSVGQLTLVKVCNAILAKNDLDGLVRLFKMTEHKGVLHASLMCSRVASKLALAGRFEDALAILNVRRSLAADWRPLHTQIEIIARDGLGQNSHLPRLFMLVTRAWDDSDIHARCSAVLASHVGPISDASQLNALLESHVLIDGNDQLVVLPLLLCGYTAKGDIASMRVVFEELKNRGIRMPESMLIHMLHLVLAQSGPMEATSILQAVFGADLLIKRSRTPGDDLMAFISKSLPGFEMQLQALPRTSQSSDWGRNAESDGSRDSS
ncbi:hypothetical protein HK105_207827 [Polyrhizophydium stewartii]|uniref:Pentatricopeptide repeat-containing protein n=1 Tax=Polyrhizophydium stewartii TaxID=2732419 RepID=A0ABR4MZQ6_9FUNG